MSYDEHLISMAGGDGEPEPLDLDAIQARADAATEGPWKVHECTPCTERGRLEVNIYDEPGNLMVTNWCDDDEFHRPDAEFIAHARTDVPALLALVREALGVADWIRDNHGDYISREIEERLRAALKVKP